MDKFIIRKEVNTLPSILVKNTLYCVKSGSGFFLYLTNSSGTLVAYPLNNSPLNIVVSNPSSFINGQQWILETDIIGSILYSQMGNLNTEYNKKYEICTAIGTEIYKQLIQ
jgi:hypothetical protein